MSKRRYNILSFLLIFSIACKTNTNSSIDFKHTFNRQYPELSSKFEEQARSTFKEKGIQGDFLFAIVNENGLVYSFALNNEIITGTPSTLDDNSPILIASHTKAFTGTLLKMLEDKGDLNLTTSLQEYLPELKFKNKIDTDKIEIRSLLNHTHGFFSNSLTWKTAYLGYSGNNDELINDLNTDFQHDPSRVFRYSNVGPIVAGMVVEKTTGNTWKDGMKEHIFRPLEMHNTSANVSEFDLEIIRPSVTVSKENGIIDIGLYKEDITMHAAGGVISTINDLSKWLSANIRQDEKLLKRDSWVDLHTSTAIQDKDYFTYHRRGYSLGWDIAEYQGDTILTRFGGLAGYSFHASFIPGKKVGILAFTSDNRAYLLPHLMANYAYNLLNSKAADSIFEDEKSKFDESFKSENEISYPTTLLATNALNGKIKGIYQSTSGWPTILIDEKEDFYTFKWGVLEGKIYETKNKYISNLGVLSREFKIENDTLITGSLLYIKN